MHTPRARRSSTLWAARWAVVLSVPLVGAAVLIATAVPREPLVLVATAALALGSAPVWASALNQLALAVRAVARPRIRADRIQGPDARRIAVVMCVADDFDAERARDCLRQDVPVEFLLLDDSATAAGRAAVDRFAAEHPTRVVRRADRTGFKGGNLSHALAAAPDAPGLWLLVDSDQSLPVDAARRLRERMLPGVAIAQGRPVPRPGSTWFARLLEGLLATHLDVAQRGRSAPWFLGRVAMLDADAVRAVGGVPGQVMEDIALTLELRRAGFRVVDVPELRGEEEAPVDLRAFRVQQLKFLAGAVELLRRSGTRIARAPIPLAERLELLLGHLLVPAAVLGGALALVGVGVLATLHAMPPGAALAGLLAGLAPFVPELTRLIRRRRPLAALGVAVVLPALYGTLLVAAVSTVLRLLAGAPAVFRVTPKAASTSGLALTITRYRLELATAALGLALLPLAPAFALPLAAPAVGSLAFELVRGYSATTSNSPRATRTRIRAPRLTSAASRTTASPARTTA